MTQPMNTDLFPETLLVDVADGYTFTSSLKIAEHFGKRHDDVLRAIRATISRCKTPEQLRNFAELFVTYTVKNGAKRKRPIFHLTRDGFTLVANSFTGEKAFDWQWDFLAAFNHMEAQLHAQTKLEAAALYKIKAHWQTIGEATKAGLSRRDICALTGHRSPDTITANKRRMRDAGLLHN